MRTRTNKNQLWLELLDSWRSDTPACQVFLAERYTSNYPNDFFGWLVLADGLTNLSSFDKSIKALCKARRLAVEPELASLLSTRAGNYYRERGDLARALRCYEKSVAFHESQENLLFVGACLAKMGRYHEAKVYHQRSADFDPTRADEAYLNLGLVYRAEANYTEAVRFFEKAIEIDPDYDEAKIARDDILKVMKMRASKKQSTKKRLASS